MTEIHIDAFSTVRLGGGEGLPASAGAGPRNMALTRNRGIGDIQRQEWAFPVLADLDRSLRPVDDDQLNRVTKAVAKEAPVAGPQPTGRIDGTG